MGTEYWAAVARCPVVSGCGHGHAHWVAGKQMASTGWSNRVKDLGGDDFAGA